MAGIDKIICHFEAQRVSDSNAFFNAPHKQRRGIERLRHAWGFSMAGLRRACEEPAFRCGLILAAIALPASAWVGRSWAESAVLVAVVVLVLIVELLNTAIEVAIDRIGPQWHELSKHAKDLASAAVLLSWLLAGGIWLVAVIAYLLH